MATKDQHYVPRVYLKAWETQVETQKEPHKKFQGVYEFLNDTHIGKGRNKERILWKPHLYTIKFNQLYMARKCSKVYSFYVDAVYDAMINNEPAPVYGKLGYSLIKTKESVRKHLMDIEHWDFYYENGGNARKKAILNKINDIRCYILEDSFSEMYENRWETIRDTFIYEVQNGERIEIGRSERRIPEKVVRDMLEFFFMMLCRSPNFDAMGIYTQINSILKSALGVVDEIDQMMEAVWFTELYRMFYKKSGGFFHSILSKVFEDCQLILFEAYDGAEMFITSDNPAFQNNIAVLSRNTNGFVFPISPKYLLFIAKGNEDITIVDHRYVDYETVQYFNRIIKHNSCDAIVGIKKDLYSML